MWRNMARGNGKLDYLIDTGRSKQRGHILELHSLAHSSIVWAGGQGTGCNQFDSVQKRNWQIIGQLVTVVKI